MSGQTSDGKVLVKFMSRPGDVLLTAAGAQTHLVPDSDAVWTAPSRASTKAPAAVRRKPCVHCAADLREVVTTPDGSWRSCPECSTKHGRQHLFLPYPREFDAAAALVAASGEGGAELAPVVDGAESAAVATSAAAVAVAADPQADWCNSCRAGQRSAGFRTCKEIHK